MKKLNYVLTIMTMLFVSLFTLTSCSDGKISGVVLYHFNDNVGDKPDVGAKVYYSKRSANPTIAEIELHLELLSYTRLGTDGAKYWLEQHYSSTIVDGIGRFSATVKPGLYDIYVVSNNRYFLDMIAFGKDVHEFDSQNIKSGKESVYNVTFK